MNTSKYLLLFGLTALVQTTSFAHDGHSSQATLLTGILHPLTGLDHVLAALAVGLIAAAFKQSAAQQKYALGIVFAFLSSALMGAMVGTQSSAPSTATALAIEGLLIGSVMTLGMLLTLKLDRLVVTTLSACVGFGFVHGFAHTIEATSNELSLHYGLGWIASTAFLLFVGFALSHWILRNRLVARYLAGLSIALTGLVMSISFISALAV